MKLDNGSVDNEKLNMQEKWNCRETEKIIKKSYDIPWLGWCIQYKWIRMKKVVGGNICVLPTTAQTKPICHWKRVRRVLRCFQQVYCLISYLCDDGQFSFDVSVSLDNVCTLEDSKLCAKNMIIYCIVWNYTWFLTNFYVICNELFHFKKH